MTDDDERTRRPSGDLAPPIADGDRPRPPRTRTRAQGSPPRQERTRLLEVTAIAIAVLLALGVVVAALDMKFEADQARWQQRQTCLEWYRLQADYGLGPWYEKLQAAAADCGGGTADNGDPLVPGGSAPALEPGERPAARPTVAPTRPPTSVAPTTPVASTPGASTGGSAAPGAAVTTTRPTRTGQ